MIFFKQLLNTFCEWVWKLLTKDYRWKEFHWMQCNKIMQRLNKYKRAPLSLSAYDKRSPKVCNCGLKCKESTDNLELLQCFLKYFSGRSVAEPPIQAVPCGYLKPLISVCSGTFSSSCTYKLVGNAIPMLYSRSTDWEARGEAQRSRLRSCDSSWAVWSLFRKKQVLHTFQPNSRSLSLKDPTVVSGENLTWLHKTIIPSFFVLIKKSKHLFTL